MNPFEVLLTLATAPLETKELLLPIAHYPVDRKSMPSSNAGTARTISAAILQRATAGSIKSASISPAFGLYSYHPLSGWSVAHIIAHLLIL